MSLESIELNWGEVPGRRMPWHYKPRPPRTPPKPTNQRLSMSRLPVELQSEIFLYCTPSALRTESTLTQYQYKKDAHFRFRLVCKSWNQVAIQTPRLWTHLTVRKYSAWSIEEVTTWLARAGGIPLTLSFSLPDYKYEFLGKLIIPHLEHTKSLSLSMPHNFFTAFHRRIRFYSAPLLQEIHLTVTSYDSRIPPGKKYLNMGKFPVLCRATFDTLWMPKGLLGRETVFNIPWSKLTALNLRESGLHEMEVLQLLLQCVNITTCELLLLDRDHVVGNIEHPNTTIWHLRELTLLCGPGLEDNPGGRLFRFLNPLRLPNLTTLGIEGDPLMSSHRSEVTKMSAAPLLELCRRSSFTLTKLTIGCVIFEMSSLLSFLRAVPTVSQLHLSHVIWSPMVNKPAFHFWRALVKNLALTYDGAGALEVDAILPRLTHFSAVSHLEGDCHGGRCRQTTACGPDDFLDAVESRFSVVDEHHAQLEKATIVWEDIPTFGGVNIFTTEVMDRVAQMQEERMNLDFVRRQAYSRHPGDESEPEV